MFKNLRKNVCEFDPWQGSILFVFLLTAVANLEKTIFGDNFQTKLGELSKIKKIKSFFEIDKKVKYTVGSRSADVLYTEQPVWCFL